MMPSCIRPSFSSISFVSIINYRSLKTTFPRPPPFDLFEFLRMPFGLRNAGQSFQRLIDSVTRGLPFVFACIDDLLVATSSAEHLHHLRLLFSRLASNGIVINAAKSEFGQPELEFLGHIVDANGIRPLPSKIRVIENLPRPSTLTKLRQFLGFVNFYHRFIPDCARLMAPLDALLVNNRKQALQWTEEATDAFTRVKSALADATLLRHPKPDAPTAIMTDGSNTAVGAVLQQFNDNAWQPLAFFIQETEACAVPLQRVRP